MSKTKPTRKGAPTWATEPFEVLFSHLERQLHLLRLSQRGITSLQKIPMIIETLQKTDIDNGKNRERNLAYAKAEADLAKREVEEGFPLLYTQAAITLWGMLDSTVNEFLSRWVANNKMCYKCPEVQKIKVKVSEYEMLTKNEKATQVIELLNRELSMTIKHGIKRYEHILKQFGLCFEVDSVVQRELIELNVVRNYAVHRKGIADSKFKKVCPWVNIKAGQRIAIAPETYRRYDAAVSAYSLSIIVRLGEYYGKNMAEFSGACKMPVMEVPSRGS